VAGWQNSGQPSTQRDHGYSPQPEGNEDPDSRHDWLVVSAIRANNRLFCILSWSDWEFGIPRPGMGLLNAVEA
jgi:hypothetical protein